MNRFCRCSTGFYIKISSFFPLRSSIFLTFSFIFLHTSTGFFDFSIGYRGNSNKQIQKKEDKEEENAKQRMREREFKSILTNFTICTRTSFIYEKYQLLNYRRKISLSVCEILYVFCFQIWNFQFLFLYILRNESENGEGSMSLRTSSQRDYLLPLILETSSRLLFPKHFAPTIFVFILSLKG